jgi:DNA-binding transcriptional LysR family regulator
VALLPESVLAVTVDGVRYRELADCDVTADVALAWRHDDPSPALAKALAVLGRHERTTGPEMKIGPV